MTVLGHWFIILAFFTSLLSALGYLRAASRSGNRTSRGRVLLYISTLLILLASALLATLILRNDFTNGYVYGYSDSTLPLHFLLSSFYAGQEGSFLFWALCSALISLLLVSYSRRHGSESGVMTVFLFVQSMLLLVVVAKSPFRSVWEMWPQVPPGSIPPDGRGLNPLLQNFWMVIHPPVLFLGFAAMAVPFSQAVAGLWLNRRDTLSRQGLPWILFAVTVLGLGIMLGAYWAYGVLGWGGYWGWDPVENSSLIPWLTGIALVHLLLVERRTGRYPRTNIILAIVSFLLVIYSTFLTRSGVLGDASVHAFTDAGSAVYWLLLLFLSLIGFSGFGFLLYRWSSLTPNTTTSGWLTRETALAAGAVALLLSAAVILFGTSLPIFSTTRVEPAFYDATNLPLAIMMALFIGISLYTQWEEQNVRFTAGKSIRALVASLALTVILFVAGMREVTTTALVFTAIFALFVNVDIAATNIKGGILLLGGKLAHVGLALFLLGVVSTGKYGSKEQIQLPREQPVSALGYTLTYEGFSLTPDNKYVFRVRAEGNGTSFTLAPVMFETGSQGIMRNPDISSSAIRDFYLSPMSLEPPQDGSQTVELNLVKGAVSDVAGARVTFARFDMGAHGSQGSQTGPEGMRIAAVIDVQKGEEREQLTPRLTYAPDGTPSDEALSSRLLRGQVKLLKISAGMGQTPSSVVLGLTHASGGIPVPEILMVEASVKPFINLLWGGTVLMMVGFVLAIVNRWREKP
jgi:cytochrome c-type biogenesis protein CcmF